MGTTTTTETAMARVAEAAVTMLISMVEARVAAGMTNDEIADDILASIRRMTLSQTR
jgi:hypothetical protein